MVDLFKELIPSILSNKVVTITAENDKEYPAFMVNKALSFHMDCILQANEMNMLHDVANVMQYDYLFHSIRSRKRHFQKWQKLEKIEDLEVIKEYYNLSNEKAKSALKLLTNTQIEELKTRLYKGGMKKRQNTK